VWLAQEKGVLVHELIGRLEEVRKRYGAGAASLEVSIWRLLYRERWRREQKRAAQQKAQAERLRHRKGR